MSTRFELSAALKLVNDGPVVLFEMGFLSHPVSGNALPKYGTNVHINILNEAGGLPTKNFRIGQFEGLKRFAAKQCMIRSWLEMAIPRMDVMSVV